MYCRLLLLSQRRWGLGEVGWSSSSHHHGGPEVRHSKRAVRSHAWGSGKGVVRGTPGCGTLRVWVRLLRDGAGGRGGGERGSMLEGRGGEGRGGEGRGGEGRGGEGRSVVISEQQKTVYEAVLCTVTHRGD